MLGEKKIIKRKPKVKQYGKQIDQENEELLTSLVGGAPDFKQSQNNHINNEFK